LSSASSCDLPPEAAQTASQRPLPAQGPSSDKEASAASFASKRELEELRIKARILENRKTEDQDRIKSLEVKVGEADTLRAARVKLQSE